jgi:hypothetical protein
MKIQTIEKANELFKQLKHMQRMQGGAVVSNLFLASVQKSYPLHVLESTAEILRDNLQSSIEEIESQIEAL